MRIKPSLRVFGTLQTLPMPLGIVDFTIWTSCSYNRNSIRGAVRVSPVATEMAFPSVLAALRHEKVPKVTCGGRIAHCTPEPRSLVRASVQ
jgi:hypothetical protein